MKIPIKYGLLITVGVIAWVLIARLLTNPASIVYTLGTPIVFNVLQFAMIYLGLKALEREKGERSTFKEGLKTGVKISFVYALTTSLFFVVLLAFLGTRILMGEVQSADEPMSSVAARAFIALFLSAMVFGLIYSTVLSFFLAKRIEQED